MTTTTWTISGQNGLTGTVTQTDQYGLLWHLIAPTGQPFLGGLLEKYFYYGEATALPYTYVDGNGLDQMAVLNGAYVTFDQEYTGGTVSTFVISLADVTQTLVTQSTGGTVGKISLQTWKIQGENGLTGIVTLLPRLGLSWNLKPASGVTLPSTINGITTTSLLPSGMTKAIPYGGASATPVTYVQSGGVYNHTDQMGVYQVGGWGGGTQDYALNTEYSGGSGVNVASTQVTVISNIAGYTWKIHYPADAPMLTVTLISGPDSVLKGSTITYTARVTNSGTVSGTATVTFYTGVTTLATPPTGTIAPGGTQDISISINTSTWSLGSYSICAKTNYE